jgi:NTP pyrophosphatase (non-canonical NTP hydrolase)
VSEQSLSPETSKDFTFEQLQELMAGFAAYEQFDNPQAVLRRGLIEETHEYVQEIAQDEVPDKEKLTGELGDILWYSSEIARNKSISLGGVAGVPNLAEFQQRVDTHAEISPITDAQGQILNPLTRPQEAISVLTLRLVDVLNPKTNELWLGYEHRLPIDQVLKDLLSCLALIANQNKIQLADAVAKTMGKLQTRARNPHVIDEASSKMMMSSMRGRLMIDPWVNSLFFKQAD